MFGGVGMQEVVIIGIIAVIIFGPRQLPKLGRSLGETLREIRNIPKAIQGDDEADG